MNTLLSTPLGRHEHPPEQTPETSRQPARRVRLLDQAALHLGVALITWSGRPHQIGARQLETREQIVNQFVHHKARTERERVAERRLLLNSPIR